MFDYGIRGGARAGSGTADFRIANNSVPAAKAAGVWFFAGNATAGETSRTCTNLIGNTIDGFNVPVMAFTDYFVEMYTGTTFQIQGLTGRVTNATNVASFIASTDTDPSPTDPEVDAGSGTTVNYTNAVCATPLIARDGAAPQGVRAAPLQPEQLTKALRTARQVLRARGITVADDRRLDTVTVSVGDLPGAYLGEAREGRIVLDIDAAGWGWFLRPNPLARDDYGGEMGAAHRLDLLAALVHELWHLLGGDRAAGSDDVMVETLPKGSRRVFGAGDLRWRDPP